MAEGAAERCRAARREIVRQRLRRAIEEARRSDLDPAEIEAILREEWAQQGNGAGDGDGETAARSDDEARTGP